MQYSGNAKNLHEKLSTYSFFVDENVGRFHITMECLVCVNKEEAVKQLLHNLFGFTLSEYDLLVAQ